jgi:hypothetical protein
VVSHVAQSLLLSQKDIATFSHTLASEVAFLSFLFFFFFLDMGKEKRIKEKERRRKLDMACSLLSASFWLRHYCLYN